MNKITTLLPSVDADIPQDPAFPANGIAGVGRKFSQWLSGAGGRGYIGTGFVTLSAGASGGGKAQDEEERGDFFHG
jgi:hypothetical protein